MFLSIYMCYEILLPTKARRKEEVVDEVEGSVG